MAHQLPDGASLRLWIEGLSIEGKDVKKGVLLPLGPRADNARARFDAAGVTVMPQGHAIQVLAVKFGSRAEKESSQIVG